MPTPTNLQNVDERGYVFVTQAADCQIVSSAENVTNAAAIPVPEKPLPGRRRVYLKNNETTATNYIYIGGPDVSSTIGYALDAGDEVILEVTDDITIYAVSTDGTGYDLRILELA